MINNKYFKELTKLAEKNSKIAPSFYKENDVKRGLRNSNGTGVKVGLTHVGSVKGYELVDNIKRPINGKLYYRGYELSDIVNAFQSEKRKGFEETVFLLLFGELPNKNELTQFNEMLGASRELPNEFTENMILKIPSKNIMNKLQRSILVLYSYDYNPDGISLENILRQSIKLIAQFPTIISYGYQAKAHYFDKKSLIIHSPDNALSTAENILHLCRSDNKYTKTEAEILDLLLVVHAEHGGGNNSAFATHVVSSSGTDTYSAIAAAVGSLKGPKHGGANSKVTEMVNDIKENCTKWKDEANLKIYLEKIINKVAFDKTGLIYGMGHAVYTYSDPRAKLLKKEALKLAKEKDSLDEYNLYSNIEKLTKEIFDKKGKNKIISANVDLYSGFVYSMLEIPPELYTPLFATARIAGWCAHRIEQLISDDKIIRPAYISVNKHRKYKAIIDRK
ncbi:citrate/2-methylcitrate synthase [Helicovermis profundi]|uniref:citrate/2-methylcitrate synthase n=1 Tax=Helicovermis profundi TaxID=3065157 RepID=UPI003BAEAFDD